MATAANPLVLTWAEYEALPLDDSKKYELSAGRLVCKAMTFAKFGHSRVAEQVAEELRKSETVRRFDSRQVRASRSIAER